MSNPDVTYSPPEDSPHSSAIVPVCTIADHSGSTSNGPGAIPPIDAINTGLATLVNTLKVNPEAADTAFVQIIGFNSSASVVMPYTHIAEASAPPALVAGGSTEYGQAFSLARRELESMIARERGAAPKLTIYRPTIYMLTDGAPTDQGWEAELDTLSTLPFAPNICVFGVEGSDETTLRKIARRDRGMVWLAEQGVDPAAAFAALFPALVRSVMLSAGAAVAGQPVPAPIPTAIPGMRMLDPLP